MLRAFVIFLTLLLLSALTAQANHYLAPFQIYIFLGGLYVTFAALRLPLRSGFVAVIAGGLLCDAAGAPALRFGTHALLFSTAFSVVYVLRDRMARSETMIRVAVALVVNLALFLGLSFARISAAPVPTSTWLRLFLDLFCSQAALALIGPWFFSLQQRSLQLARSESPNFS